MAFEFGTSAGVASQGGVTPLPGGLPIRFHTDIGYDAVTIAEIRA